jgi:heme/copper-type cytochrome/quinol oxidase subunit 2
MNIGKRFFFKGSAVFLVVSFVGVFLTFFPLQSVQAQNQVTIHMTASIVKIVKKNGKMYFEGGWNPRKITVQEGDQVTLIITSLDVDHSFYLPEYHIDKYIPSGQTVTVEFTANKAGVFVFSCGDETLCGATHRFMVGELVVTAPKK